MEEGRKLRVWELAALLALCLAMLAGTWAQARQNSISRGLVRLHVIAVSDAAEEQELKLQVRDAVLAYLEPVLMGVEDREQAREILSADLNGIAQAAASAAQGRQVQVSLGRERYPSREYEGFTLPAGEYESLRIVLGEGQGHNWWCIVFPPLCVSAAQAEQVQSVMSREDYGIVTEQEGYALRFRVVELWGELTGRLADPVIAQSGSMVYTEGTSK